MRVPFSMALSPESEETRPARTFIKVDFPLPFAPVKADFVPEARFIETSFNISLSPKAKDTLENCTKATTTPKNFI